MKQRINRLDQLETLVATAVDKAGTICPQTQAVSTESQSSPSLSNDQSTPSEISGLDLLSWTPPSSQPSPDWDLMGYIDPVELIDMEQEVLRPQWRMDYVDSGSLKVQDVSTMAVSLRNQPSQLNFNPTTLAADPHINHIAFQEVNLMEALSSICHHIGCTEQMFHDPTAMSPFYRPGCSTTPETRTSQEFVKGIQNIFKTLKPDLRPVEEQVIFPHNPGIDAMPFPTFRKNLLTTKHCIESEEGCEDMMRGLVCWGTAGLTKSERANASGRVSTGMPWDGRSWEARPWFLRKYWDLLGGDDGELVIQSEWWRRSRGEDADIWEMKLQD